MTRGTELSRSTQTQLFTVRIWPEEVGKDGPEWRGRVQHIPTGASRYFRDWETLTCFIRCTLAGTAALPAEESQLTGSREGREGAEETRNHRPTCRP